LGTINFAVIGCGHIGKRHATIIHYHPDCNLVALCDIRPKEDLAIDDFEIPFFDTMSSLLDSDLPIDVVCICTPNYLHASQSLLAINKDLHVVCEKPMGLSKASCEEVIHAALNKNRRVFCVMQNRYSPPSQWIKEVIEKKLLGDIYFVHADCFWNRDERYYQPEGKSHLWKGIKETDGGTLFTQFSHFIDMLYWLFGDIQNINARFFDFNHKNLTEFEDSGCILFDFVQGGAGSINYSTSVYDQNFESSLTIIGKKGTVKIGGQYMNKIEYCNIQDYQMLELPEAGPPNDYGTYTGSAANHHYVIQNVVDVLKGNKKVTTNALEGLKVVEIIERIYECRK
jgi:UDP-N-acetyl-2-amino-2-deoxyglucuronate dehydrogenase